MRSGLGWSRCCRAIRVRVGGGPITECGRHSFSEWWWFVVRIVPFGFGLGFGWWLWFRDGFRFANVLVAVGAGPDVSAVAVFHTPSALVLEPVVVPA